MTHKFNPEHIGRLLGEERLMEMDPEGLLKNEGLKEGYRFADVGCGPGFFTIPAADIVGASGKVYAIDTQEEMLHELEKRDPPPNVVLVKSVESEIPLEDGSSDMALLAYVLHEAEDTVLFLKEVGRILTDDGSLLILDWKKKAEDKGPPMEDRLTEEEVLARLKEAGFVEAGVSSLTKSHYKITALKGAFKNQA
jgi:ubiquinone/menaquinone biosynthesis C-methylase UbiE